jgi:hypothetical protein
MDFIEIVDSRSVDYLLSQLSAPFVAQFTDAKEEDITFARIKKVLRNFQKNGGSCKTTYKKSPKDKYKLYRDYADGIQALPSNFRNLICSTMTDIDTVNCFPTIIWNVCRQKNIDCAYLEMYIKRRDELIADGKADKIAILKSINKKFKQKGTNFIELFDIEMKQIQKQLMDKQEYEQHLEYAKENNPKNVEGSFMTCLATYYESEMIQHLITFLQSKNIEIGVLMFDGIMIYGKVEESLMEQMSDYIKKKMGFDLQYKMKPMVSEIVIPADWKSTDYKQLYDDTKRKNEIDNKLAFIRSSSNYSFTVNGKMGFFTKDNMKQQFQNEFIGINNFFDLWLIDPERLTYDSLDLYPYDTVCPDNILNIWTPLAVQSVAPKQVDISLFYEHLNNLFDEQEVKFLLDWIANMFQYPSSRSLLPIISGEQGSGKSLIADFLKNIIGLDKYYECNDIKTQLFGTFNGHLSGKLFINLEELSREDMIHYADKIKTKITSPVIDIHFKGMTPYQEKQIAHFLCNTNHLNPINFKKGDRRYGYLYAKPTKIGDTEYFTELYKMIDSKSVQYTFYQDMMNRPVKKQLTIVDIPMTQRMLEVMDNNRDYVDEYAENFLGVKTSSENYTEFCHFMEGQGIRTDKVLTRKAFEMKFLQFYAKYGIEKIDCDVKAPNGERIRRRFSKLALEMTPS